MEKVTLDEFVSETKAYVANQNVANITIFNPTIGTVIGTIDITVYTFNPDSTQLGAVMAVTFIATDAFSAADTIVTNFRIDSFLRGDLDDNAKYTMNDVVYVVNYIFHNGQAPNPLNAGDIDYSGGINVADIAYLINFMYKAGPRPPQ